VGPQDRSDRGARDAVGCQNQPMFPLTGIDWRESVTRTALTGLPSFPFPSRFVDRCSSVELLLWYREQRF
jgi:hypothetical protein